MQKILLGGVCALEMITLPLVYQSVNWSWQLACAVAMAVCLACVRMQLKANWWRAAALVFGCLASVGHWLWVPLMLAQVGLAWLAETQNMPVVWRESLWLVQVAFVQAGLFDLELSGLTWQVLVLIGLLLVPVAAALWASRLPLWVSGLVLLFDAGIGLLSQQYSLLAAVLLVLVPAALSTRVLKYNGVIMAALGVLIAMIVGVTRLHG
ncbi:hypothetical protein [Lacticaseibacillus jixiensis]|uniref:hypothetical protein n=1 Tax=Lacticaseibacillus jixiensis TaxID=3231926 RepID=UPI0036F2EA78